MNIEKRVRRGIKALIKAGHPHWMWEIDPDELNTLSTANCPLGQLYGEYALSPRNLRDRGSKLGFDSEEPHDVYELLDVEWRKQILMHRAVTDEPTPDPDPDTWLAHDMRGKFDARDEMSAVYIRLSEGHVHAVHSVSWDASHDAWIIDPSLSPADL